MTTKVEATTGFLGFESLHDFFTSLVGAKHFIINLLGAFIGAVTSFILDYMWDSQSAVYTLWILMLADWVTGIAKGCIKKRFVSFKIFRMPLYFIATSFLISISWWMAKGNGLFIFLPGLVMGGFYAVYFTSILENMGEVGLLPKSLVKVLRNKFGLKTIVKKYFEDSKIDEDDTAD